MHHSHPNSLIVFDASEKKLISASCLARVEEHEKRAPYAPFFHSYFNNKILY